MSNPELAQGNYDRIGKLLGLVSNLDCVLPSDESHADYKSLDKLMSPNIPAGHMLDFTQIMIDGAPIAVKIL